MWKVAVVVIVKGIIRHFPERIEKATKTSVMLAGFRAEISTRNHSNTNQKFYLPDRDVQ
jgi:hypothetical protein